MITFFRGSNRTGPHVSLDNRKNMIATAYYITKKKFNNVSGGSHPLTFKGTLELISAMNVEPSDQIWEIGCGLPVLAASLSAASGNTVLCTDIGDAHRGIADAIESFMARREISKSNDLLDMIYREKLDNVNKITQDYKPFANDELTLDMLCTALDYDIAGIVIEPLHGAVPVRTRRRVCQKATSVDDNTKDSEDEDSDGDENNSSFEEDNSSSEEDNSSSDGAEEDKNDDGDAAQEGKTKQLISPTLTVVPINNQTTGTQLENDQENNFNFANVWSKNKSNVGAKQKSSYSNPLSQQGKFQKLK